MQHSYNPYTSHREMATRSLPAGMWSSGGMGSYRPAVYPRETGWPQQMPTYAMLSGPGPGTAMSLPPTTVLAPSNPSPSPTSPTSEAATTHHEPGENCGDEMCNNEARAGGEGAGEYVWCGIDFKPALPPALAVSTLTAALCMLLVQIPLFCRLKSFPQGPLIAFVIAQNALTLALMGYCTFADPGQTKKKRNLSTNGIDLEEGLSKPRRAHKSWQYARPVRRYDHYCKWLNNVVGLLNHREFVLMLIGLSTIGLLGVAIDGYLAVLIAKKGMLQAEIMIVLHLSFSLALLAIEVPIFKIHYGLVSRNELAQEWKHNIHYIANNTTQGDGVPVEELDDDEYNELFDKGAFIYDPSRNPWDKGCYMNCVNFWCWPRWPAGEKGEF